MKQKCASVLLLSAIAGLAVLMAVSYNLFVFPNAFSPAGINGLITMAQYLFHFNIGYLSLLVNLPLLLFAWKRVGSRFAWRTLVFVVFFSVSNLILGQLDLSAVSYHTENGTSVILGPIAAGAVSGLIYGFVFSREGSTGGMDILAAWVHVRHPDRSFVWTTFCLNASVAVLSFFVYGFRFEPVIMCLIYCFISTRISDFMLKGGKKALKFEVVTDRSEELSRELLRELRHGVTVLPGMGMYEHTPRDLVICIINPHQIARFHQVLSHYPHTFSYVSEVNETVGNFKHISDR